jgi:hypothetical protein
LLNSGTDIVTVQQILFISKSAKDEYLAEQLEDILLASVEASGGARNISGFYGISDELANLLRDWLAEEKIVLDC